MLEAEKIIIEVLSSCHNVYERNDTFNAKQIIENMNLIETNSDKEKYWQEKNITNSLNHLEKIGFIEGNDEPEYTSSSRILKEVRYGRVTKKGKIFNKLPNSIKITTLSLIMNKNKFLSLLGILSLIKLVHNANLGLSLLAGWLEWLSVAIVLFIIFTLISRALERIDN